MSARHILLALPDEWTNDQRGDFFEAFVADILKPMRFAVERRLRVTGMEIDILAKGLDQPKRILVECKAQRDTLPADVISKLLGNVTIRGVDAGWLFSAGDLSKDGRGQMEEIQSDPKLSALFTWYSPSRLIEVLISQKAVVDPCTLTSHAAPLQLGDATLICSPTGKRWLLELLQEGLPTYFLAFDAIKGILLSEDEAISAASASDRLGSLRYYSRPIAGTTQKSSRPLRAPVARVIPGDAWDDLRPARPLDFVGRDDAIGDILDFLTQVQCAETTTRTFSIQGPSGWGKSSLVLKLADIARKKRKLRNCSLTAVDTRSATNSAFVTSAIRTALVDAKTNGILPKELNCDIQSLTYPLDSEDVEKAMLCLSDTGSIIVLIFDQFEELFSKETLFDTFTAIRELSLDLDGKQSRIVLGFAWKTDISLPQQHPAYHLWHELSDRRKDFRIKPFGSGDITRVISKAEKLAGVSLAPALRGRLLDQCQGYPWLLKKLLVHVFNRLHETASQFVLLERELDVEVLFKEDLADLNGDQLRCLTYVAERSPVYVSEVEEHFGADTANFLLGKRLLVRSGLNYAVYWDIFRDYLVNKRVPQIPWARNFQRDPRAAVLALQFVWQQPMASAQTIASHLGTTERSCTNLMSDLVALQLVDRVAEDSYKVAPHLTSVAPMSIAEHMHRQFARHAMCRELARYDRETLFRIEELEGIVRKIRASETRLSDKVVHQYAMTLRRWLLFSGHIEQRDRLLCRPSGRGASLGVMTSKRTRKKVFLGSGTADALFRLVILVSTKPSGIPEDEIIRAGSRNSLYDALALGLVSRSEDKRVNLTSVTTDPKILLGQIKMAILTTKAVQIVAAALVERPAMSNSELGEKLRMDLNETWKRASAVRYANGVRGFYTWARTDKSESDRNS